MEPLQLVQCLEKCQGMAMKLKAAKFLRDTGKASIEEMRRYARDLLTGAKEEDDGDTVGE
jgi:hypothetical protein